MNRKQYTVVFKQDPCPECVKEDKCAVAEIKKHHRRLKMYIKMLICVIVILVLLEVIKRI